MAWAFGQATRFGGMLFDVPTTPWVTPSGGGATDVGSP